LRGKRNEYPIRIWINSQRYDRVIIDQHYREKHSESIDDKLILELVGKLDGELVRIEGVRGQFQYSTEVVMLNERFYRLVLVIDIFENFLGVINAFRVDRR
jgi:hypothetical protein